MDTSLYVFHLSSLLKTALELEVDLNGHLQMLDASFSEPWDKIRPRLAANATQQQLYDAEIQLTKDFNDLRKPYRERLFREIMPRIRPQIALFKQISSLAKMYTPTTADKLTLEKILENCKWGVEVYEIVSLLSRDLDASHSLLQRTQDLAISQSNETRAEYVEKLAERSVSHVTPYTGNMRPRFDTVRKLMLPVEVMYQIYSFSDIESCCSLREVSTEWNVCFHQIEDTLRMKLTERNPWLKPDGKDLRTYADCALVFAKRVKWPSVFHIDQLERVQVTEKHSHPYCTFALRDQARLPDTFTGMLPYDVHCTEESENCDHFHVTNEHRDEMYVQDLRTYEVYNVNEQPVIDLPVIRFKGFEITLSPETKAGDIVDFFAVELFAKSALVRFKNGSVLVVPRDKPSYEFGFTDYLLNGQLREIGGVLYYTVDGKNTWALDIERRIMHQYAEDSTAYPVATHKGLSWWVVDEKKILPLFVDLSNPDNLHYNSKRALWTDEFADARVQGRGDGAKYLIERVDKGTNLIDLDAGSVTNMRGREKGTHHIPGFENGKFKAYSIASEVADRKTELVFYEAGVPLWKYKTGPLWDTYPSY